MLDFFMIVVIDMANQDTNGDLYMIYDYYSRTNAGFIGLFLTFLA